MKRSTKLALSGIMTAMCVVLVFLTGILPGATYALPALAGILLAMCVEEIGVKWTTAIFISSAILSLVLTADKEAAILYTAFFGYYPMAKVCYEKISNWFLGYIIKFGTFNLSIALAYAAIVFVFRLPNIDFSFFGINLPALMLFIANAVFLLYDITISRVTKAYFNGLHKRIRKILRY